jgi:hypothetical protein
MGRNGASGHPSDPGQQHGIRRDIEVEVYKTVQQDGEKGARASEQKISVPARAGNGGW